MRFYATLLFLLLATSAVKSSCDNGNNNDANSDAIKELRQLIMTSVNLTNSLLGVVNMQGQRIADLEGEQQKSSDELCALSERAGGLETSIAALEKRLSESDVTLGNLTSTISNEVDALHLDISNQGDQITAVQTSLDDLETHTDDAIGGVDTTLDQVRADIVALKQKPADFPAKSFCILANGDCPPGFTRREGHIRAISTYAADGNYIRSVNFGSSNIRCHGSCGRWPNWYAELNLATCCK